MTTTRDNFQSELERRLGDTSNAVWSDAENAGFLDGAIESLYPYWFRRRVDSTSATAGPLQTAPAGCRNVYRIGYQRSGSTRARKLRGWSEGDGEAYITKTGITDDTLIWCWTEGWDAPAAGATVLTVPTEAKEAVLVRAQISAMEKLLVDRVSAGKYYALQVRQASTDTDLATTLDALHATLKEHYEKAMQLPTIES